MILERHCPQRDGGWGTMDKDTAAGDQHANRSPPLAEAPEGGAEYRAEPKGAAPRPPSKHGEWAGVANVFVLSSDALLIDIVHRAAAGQPPVVAVVHWRELIAAVEANRCDVVLLDVDHLGLGIAKRLVELQPYATRVVTLVAANRNDAQALIGFLADHKVHRLLIKPAPLGQTRLILESAVTRCVQLRQDTEGQQPSPPEQPVPLPRRIVALAQTHWARQPHARSLLAAAILVAGLIGLTQVLKSRSPAIAEPAASELDASGTPQAPAMARGKPSIAALTVGLATPGGMADRYGEQLAGARQAFAAGRLAEPRGDNALDYYLGILIVEPEHGAASEELEGVLEALFTQAEAALLDGSLDAAAGVLAHVRRAEPNSARLAFLEAQLQRLARDTDPAKDKVAAGDAADAASVAASSVSNELASLLTIAAARIERGQLLTPAGDSARDYIARATALGPSDERVVAVRAQVASAVVGSAQRVLASGDFEQSARLSRTARDLGAEAPSLAALDAAISAARAEQNERRKAELLATGAERLTQGALVEPAEDSAFYHLSTLRAETPDYPGLDESWQALMETFGANGRTAIAAREWPVAETWLDALTRADADSPRARELREELETARLQEQYLVSAAPASELALLEYTLPAYPDAALRDGVEGWVDIEFVIGGDGGPREIIAVAAEPPGRFEEAALAAVANYRYRPFELDGRVYERRLRLRLRFTLERERLSIR